MSFDSDLNACAALVQKADADRFAAVMASPVPAREVLFPLYAFNVEVSRAPWVTQETMIAEMRLQWWRDAVEEIEKDAQVRRHEVVTPLARVIGADVAPLLDRLVAARRWDIYKDAFEDAAHFERYIDETAGGLMWAAARALGQPVQTETEARVRALGFAAGLARFLQAVPALEAHKRIPLVDGRPEAVADLAGRALKKCPGRSEVKSLLTPAARPAVTEAFLAQSLLRRVVANPMAVAQGALAVSPVRRSWQLWRWS